jgi:organic hydroperoxide reductase OsmC/OhrA
MKQHTYEAGVEWTGNDGEGTKAYKGYRRDHVIRVKGKPDILGSSDPLFRGDPSRHNPEDLLVASVSACHMLWYLHLCATNHVTVEAYSDVAQGVMQENKDGSGEFVQVTLRPTVVILDGDPALALRLHEEAHGLCFIARSVRFPVEIKAAIHQAGLP